MSTRTLYRRNANFESHLALVMSLFVAPPLHHHRLSEAAGVSYRRARDARYGALVPFTIARKIARALGVEIPVVFTAESRPRGATSTR